jgi:nucleotide-binding universal stress UspA family protein
MKVVAGAVMSVSLVWDGCSCVERSIDEGFRAVKQVVLGVELLRSGLWFLVFGLRKHPRNNIKTQDQRPKAMRMQIRTILLPTDFSECGNYALSYAASLARTFRASIICINVIEPIVPTVGYSGMAEPMPIADIAEQLEDSAERELPKLAECEECAGLDIEEMVVHGEAASEIVRVAKEREVDLIVIASHGRTGLGRILFGSTAESVVRHASCPVLVVKPPQAESPEE